MDWRSILISFLWLGLWLENSGMGFRLVRCMVAHICTTNNQVCSADRNRYLITLREFNGMHSWIMCICLIHKILGFSQEFSVRRKIVIKEDQDVTKLIKIVDEEKHRS